MILSSGIIPLRKNEEQWEYLLLRCFKYWDFPKGHGEKDESPLVTAIREMTEETTISAMKMPWGEIFYETEMYSKGKIARYYLAQVDMDAKVELLPNPENGITEHHEYRWVTYEEAMRLANPRIKKVVEWSRRIISPS